MRAKTGDEIIVEPQQLGGQRREGKVLEVLGRKGHEHFRIQWDDGRESMFFPGPDAALRHTVSIKELRKP